MSLLFRDLSDVGGTGSRPGPVTRRCGRVGPKCVGVAFWSLVLVRSVSSLGSGPIFVVRGSGVGV